MPSQFRAIPIQAFINMLSFDDISAMLDWQNLEIAGVGLRSKQAGQTGTVTATLFRTDLSRMQSMLFGMDKSASER